MVWSTSTRATLKFFLIKKPIENRHISCEISRYSFSRRLTKLDFWKYPKPIFREGTTQSFSIKNSTNTVLARQLSTKNNYGSLVHEYYLPTKFKFSRDQTPYSLFLAGNYQSKTLTLLMAQWVDMEALENKNHASLMLFLTSGRVARTIMRSVRGFVSFHVHPLSH